MAETKRDCLKFEKLAGVKDTERPEARSHSEYGPRKNGCGILRRGLLHHRHDID